MVQVPAGAKELFRGEHYTLWEMPRTPVSED
jgi:hypothetical protein